MYETIFITNLVFSINDLISNLLCYKFRVLSRIHVFVLRRIQTLSKGIFMHPCTCSLYLEIGFA